MSNGHTQASSAWVLPTEHVQVTEWFGAPGASWASGYHTGIDFAADYGTPVLAVAAGTVTRVGWSGAYGKQVVLRLSNGDQVWYNHLSSFSVATGAQVSQAQRLGRVGDTGNAYGYHLHLELHRAADPARAVDPAPAFRRHGLPLRAIAHG